MGDSAESANQSTEEPQATQFAMEWVADLEGRAVFPAERDGKFVWLVAEGAMTKQCFTEMYDYLSHIVGSGMWTQNWKGQQRQRLT
ncbi:hypothetical protein [Streptomyces sp. CL7]|uniref:hypothetical protein n=1 Tax=Streptomyces sp. CL7 TaxID=3096006 RepID=UPI002A74B660|nr:hypothetical protein [Streptomyces sp. CL7]WPP29987.1 hypothetical protein SJH97_11875 [Streptomyces sp. CL7]